MTELTLKVNHAAKSVQTTGRVAVGEDVALNLVMDEEVADLAQLRVRLRFMGRDVAVFPFPGSGDEWAEGEAGENEYTYTGVINLNTVQLNALFAELGDGAVLTCAVVVDQVSNDDGADDYNVLYGKGAIRVWNWGGDLSVTPDVDEAPAPVSLRECLEGKVDKVVTATNGNVAVFVNNESVQGGITDANVSIDNGGAPITSGVSLPTVSKVGSIVSGSLSPISAAIAGLRAAVQQKADATALSGKVDKEDGKTLSSNDFTNALKAKLDGIESGAEKNVGVEFTQTEKAKLAGIADEATKIVVDEEFDNQSGNAISNARVAAFHEGYHTFKNLVEGTYLPAKADLVNGKVPSAELPSYVDDVLEYASLSVFPATGEAGKIYVALDTNKTYRWGGTGYVEISPSLALGETASTAYAGNKGKANAEAIAAIKDGANIDSFGDVEDALAGKADKVANATANNLAALDASGNLTDSGKKAADFATAAQGAKADAAVQSVNGVTPTAGAVTITGANIETAEGSGNSILAAIINITQDVYDVRADLRYALPSDPLTPDPETDKYALNDREANWINTPLASVKLVFPAPILGRLRDFEVYISSASVDTGNVALICEGYDSSDAIELGNGAGAVPDIPLGGDTVLYFSEVREGHFILKGEKFVAITGGN